MSCTNLRDMRFKQGASNLDMSIAVLEFLQTAGVSRAKAVSLVALSGREVDYIWWEQRDTIATRKIGAPENECLCRQVIGLERERTQVGYQLSTCTDAEAIAFLQAQGMVQAGGPHGCKPAGKAAQPDGAADYFEWCMARKKGKLLDNFSVGPTQMYLRFFFEPAFHPGQVVHCGMFQSFEDIWSFYTNPGPVPDEGPANLGDLSAPDQPAILLEHITYLDPICLGPGIQYPGAPTGGGKANVVAWLTRHVGNATGADKYYEGAGIGPGKAYKNMLFIANQAADAIGYQF